MLALKIKGEKIFNTKVSPSEKLTQKHKKIQRATKDSKRRDSQKLRPFLVSVSVSVPETIEAVPLKNTTPETIEAVPLKNTAPETIVPSKNTTPETMQAVPLKHTTRPRHTKDNRQSHKRRTCRNTENTPEMVQPQGSRFLAAKARGEVVRALKVELGLSHAQTIGNADFWHVVRKCLHD